MNSWGRSEADRAALALLAGWDGAMRPDAPQPLIFNAWLQQFDAALLQRQWLRQADRNLSGRIYIVRIAPIQPI